MRDGHSSGIVQYNFIVMLPFQRKIQVTSGHLSSKSLNSFMLVWVIGDAYNGKC